MVRYGGCRVLLSGCAGTAPVGAQGGATWLHPFSSTANIRA